MADNSLYTLADKRYVFPPPTNHKEEIITPKTREAELIRAGRELKVAFTVMARHGLIDEFKNAVMSPAKDPEPEVVKKQLGESYPI